jgi:hypothetical protein
MNKSPTAIKAGLLLLIALCAATSAPPASSAKTPPCEALGVTLEMPAHTFRPGDTCSLTAYVCNPDTPLTDVPLVVLRDAFGAFYFYPSWCRYPQCYNWNLIDFVIIPVLETGQREMEIIPAFTWPSGVGEASGLYFYAAMTDFQELIGEMGSWEFAYTE